MYRSLLHRWYLEHSLEFPYIEISGYDFACDVDTTEAVGADYDASSAVTASYTPISAVSATYVPTTALNGEVD